MVDSRIEPPTEIDYTFTVPDELRTPEVEAWLQECGRILNEHGVKGMIEGVPIEMRYREKLDV